MNVTCGECQDLLLDLAYGELSPVRAAEVEAHAAGCESCARERQQIASARMLITPLLRIEEPPASIDEPILEAARAEAERFAAAANGESRRAAAGPRVLEMVGSIGMPQAASTVDARAPLRAVAGPKRRWALRVALGGSMAAAAALLLTVTRLSDRAPTSAAVEGEQRERAIHIRVPGDEAEAGKAQPPLVAAKPAAAPPVEKAAPAKLAELQRDFSRVRPSPAKGAKAKVAARSKEAAKDTSDDKAFSDETLSVDFGGEAKPLDKAEALPPPPPPAPLAKSVERREAASAPPMAAPDATAEAAAEAVESAAAEEAQAARGRGMAAAEERKAKKRVAAAAPPKASAEPPAGLGALSGSGASDSSAGFGKVGNNNIAGGSGSAGPSQSDGDEAAKIAAQLETRARTMRMSGSFSEAAILYKQAAALHARAAEAGASPVPTSNQAVADSPRLAKRDVTNQVAGQIKGPGSRDQRSAAAAADAAALDLAHAVECYAADARIDEARRTYEDLLTQYPGATVAHATAQRALRTALPSRPAAKQYAPRDDASKPEEPPAADAVSK